MSFFNTKNKKITTKGEKVLKSTGVDWKVAIFGTLPCSVFLFFIILPFIDFVIIGDRFNMSKFLTSKMLITHIRYAFIIWFSLMITYKLTKYTITNEGIYYPCGWAYRSFIPYNKITKVKIYRSIIDKIFNTGSLKISTSLNTTVRVIYIKDYKKVNDILNKHIK